MARNHTTGGPLGDGRPGALRSKEDGEPDRRPRAGSPACSRRCWARSPSARCSASGSPPCSPRPRCATSTRWRSCAPRSRSRWGWPSRSACSASAQAAEGARPHRRGPGAAGHAHGRLRGGGGHAGGAREPRGPRLVPARPLPALRHLRADRAALRPPPPQPVFRPEWRTDLWHFGVSHLLVQLTVFLTMAPAAIFFRWAVAPGAPGRGGRAALRAAVRRGAGGRRPHPVHRAPPLPPGALALALPRDPPLEPADGLAGRLAPAPGGHRGHARALLRAALRAGLRAGRRSSPTCSSCPSRRCSSTPTCAGASARCASSSPPRSTITGTTRSSRWTSTSRSTCR